MLILSEKFKTFIKTETKRDFLEGTTAAGKTTVGIFKFILMVYKSSEKDHVIAGTDIGTVEKNIINSKNGILNQFKGYVEYFASGKGKIRLSHLELKTKNGIKIIYVCGFDNKKRWQKVLGSQVGCAYVDEVNIADMEFLRELSHRCLYLLTTSNPDAPDKMVYSEFINNSRPLKKYLSDYPADLLNELNPTAPEGFVHWYFTFFDNASMTQEDIERKKNAVPVGTKMYKNKILGLRGKATGLVFCNFDEKTHVISEKKAKKFEYQIFSCGVDTAYSKKSEDTIAISLIGIEKNGKCIILEEKVYNNTSLTTALAPSDTVINIVDFLDRCTKKWGYIKNIFIDAADQATITECEKYKRNHYDCRYIFYPAYKKMKIIDRINLQLGWFSTQISEPYIYICENCITYIKELNSYSWKEDKDEEPEDANDHVINSVQYAWLPYVKKIGLVKKI